MARKLSVFSSQPSAARFISSPSTETTQILLHENPEKKDKEGVIAKIPYPESRVWQASMIGVTAAIWARSGVELVIMGLDLGRI